MKRHRGSVRRPLGGIGTPRRSEVKRHQQLLLGSVARHGVDLLPSRASRYESDPSPVRRIRRGEIIRKRSRREALDTAHLTHIDPQQIGSPFPRLGKDDESAVGGKHRRDVGLAPGGGQGGAGPRGEALQDDRPPGFVQVDVGELAPVRRPGGTQGRLSPRRHRCEAIPIAVDPEDPPPRDEQDPARGISRDPGPPLHDLVGEAMDAQPTLSGPAHIERPGHLDPDLAALHGVEPDRHPTRGLPQFEHEDRAKSLIEGIVDRIRRGGHGGGIRSQGNDLESIRIVQVPRENRPEGIERRTDRQDHETGTDPGAIFGPEDDPVRGPGGVLPGQGTGQASQAGQQGKEPPHGVVLGLK